MGAETPLYFLGLHEDWLRVPSDQQALLCTMLLIADE
jgi:hypothetical protein